MKVWGDSAPVEVPMSKLEAAARLVLVRSAEQRQHNACGCGGACPICLYASRRVVLATVERDRAFGL